MDGKHQAFLTELLNTPSPTGQEMAGQRKWASYIENFADSLECDAYGNTWATLNGRVEDGLKIMLEAHADEIGFMINYISDEGFLSIVPVGGSDAAITRGKRVIFYGDDGAEVKGVIANTAIHLRKDLGSEKAPKWSEVFVDIGAKDKKAVEARGLRVGHFGVYDYEPLELSENRLTSRAIDNRISGYILARVFENLKQGEQPQVSTYVVNAIQEEIGGHGATMVSYRLFPDVAICFDVTHATDTPGIDKKKHGEVKLGKGPTVTHGTANHPLLVQRIVDIAKREQIPLQHEASSRYTGTDTDSIYTAKTGIPSALISIPLRYMHSPVEIVDLEDVENTIKLVTALILDLKPDEVFEQAL